MTSTQIITGIAGLVFIFSAAISVPATAGATEVQALLAAPERKAEDRQRDQRDKAAELIAFMNLKPGDQVVDVFAGGGYWSELFAAAVGPTGNVLVHNNKAYRTFVGPDVHKRFHNKPLPQVSLHDREVDDLDLTPASQDVIFMGLSFHDLYFVDAAQGWPAIDDQAFMQQLADALVTQGRLIIVDHEAKSGTGVSAAQTLHRIERKAVVERVTSFGFKLTAQSALLENKTDPLDISVFDQRVRGQTSRFILVFEKMRKI